ncbi:MAG: glutamyl-tRNA reductase [Candidatus Nanopelagicales bacterium]|nr:glutamyl-tRNA reductase [Candidatus Nanopelagicales bacterium]
MSLLVVGVSHHSAPIEVLEAVAAADTESALPMLAAADAVAEALLLSTCNRIEVYTEVSRFHAAVEAVTAVLAKSSGMTVEDLSKHLYVHYEDAAVRHAFRVTSGLDSMVLGDEQILGQFREAFKAAVDQGQAGRNLHELAQSALRIGKRVQTDTGIGRHGASVVEVALGSAQAHFGSLAQRHVVIVGSGSMSSLAASVASANGARVTIVGRTAASVHRLAQAVGGSGRQLVDLDEQLRTADVVVSATGATGLLITAEHLRKVLAGMNPNIYFCDLALPHDTDPAIATIPGVHRLDLAGIAELPQARVAGESVTSAEQIVIEATGDFVSRQTSARVEPVVVALRSRAEEVVEAELERLRLRGDNLTDEQFTQIAHAMRRVVATLLHTPTVRMKEFAIDPGGDRYAAALHALFDLDPQAVSALTDPRGPSA